MIHLSLLTIFIPTFFFVSLTPGMCMTLSLTLGMSIGIRKTFWMMWGELAGVAIVSIAAVTGVATVMVTYPSFFLILKYVGGAYLFYLGIRLWQSSGKMAIEQSSSSTNTLVSRKGLIGQGFIAAIANPKGWAFMISLLPPFINKSSPILPQLTILLSIILIIEFTCLILYASGGKRLKSLMHKKGSITLLNKIAGTLMIGVAIWLATS
jgi:homoserine/homoserine lactone efflux protein